MTPQACKPLPSYDVATALHTLYNQHAPKPDTIAKSRGSKTIQKPTQGRTTRASRRQTSSVSSASSPGTLSKKQQDEIENDRIFTLRYGSQMHWRNIVRVMNDEAEAEGFQPHMTESAVSLRFKRNAVRIARQRGIANFDLEYWMHISFDKNGKVYGRVPTDSPESEKEVRDAPLNVEQRLLVELLEEDKMGRWQRIAPQMSYQLGKILTAEECMVLEESL